jgi:hypothetical protein
MSVEQVVQEKKKKRRNQTSISKNTRSFNRKEKWRISNLFD